MGFGKWKDYKFNGILKFYQLQAMLHLENFID